MAVCVADIIAEGGQVAVQQQSEPNLVIFQEDEHHRWRWKSMIMPTR
jgi:hypothetical protein